MRETALVLGDLDHSQLETVTAIATLAGPSTIEALNRC